MTFIRPESFSSVLTDKAPEPAEQGDGSLYSNWLKIQTNLSRIYF